MVKSINSTFMKETCLFEINSPMLLEEHSKKQAEEQFKWLWAKIQVIIEENGAEEKNLITILSNTPIFTTFS